MELKRRSAEAIFYFFFLSSCFLELVEEAALDVLHIAQFWL